MSTIDLRTHEGKVRTYDGHEAQILATNIDGDRPVAVQFLDKGFKWRMCQVKPDGTMKKDDEPFIVPVPSLEKELASFEGVGYTNIRRTKEGRIVCGTLYPTQEAAEKKVNQNTILTVPVSLKRNGK